MKLKKRACFATIMMLVLALFVTACAGNTGKDPKESGKLKPGDAGYVPAAQDVADQGYDFYDKAQTYDEVVEALGPIPIPEKEYELGFVCKAFENEFWRMIKDGSEDAVIELAELGITLKMDVNAAQGESDESGQLAIMNDMVNKKYAGILTSPISDGNLLPAVERALENDIEMVVVNSTFMADIDTTVGAWHWRAGEFAAKWINDKIGGEGKVAIITGMPKSNSARSRTDAFVEWFEKNSPNVEIVDIQNGDWDRMKAKEITDTWMKSIPDLQGIYANNDTMAMGSIEAVISANRLGECYVVGTDGTSEAIESIREGELSATVNSYPYYLAKIGVEMLIRKLEGQDVPKVIYTPQVVIDIDNVHLSDDELVNWKGFNVAKP